MLINKYRQQLSGTEPNKTTYEAINDDEYVQRD